MKAHSNDGTKRLPFLCGGNERSWWQKIGNRSDSGRTHALARKPPASENGGTIERDLVAADRMSKMECRGYLVEQRARALDAGAPSRQNLVASNIP